MLCNYPVKMYRKKDGSYDHKYCKNSVQEIERPCGNCIACKITKVQNWTTRLVHEARTSTIQPLFITLTYSDDDQYSLDYNDLNKFHTGLRSSIYPKRFTYFSVGEYGENYGRPHYHSILYNYHFSNKTYYKRSASGRKLFNSPELDKRWTHGFANYAYADESAMKYCAGYTLKKMIGDQYRGQAKIEHYGYRETERSFASRNPAIGLRWLIKNYKQFADKDYCIIDSTPVPIPPYYVQQMLEGLTPDRLIKYGLTSMDAHNTINSMRSIAENIKLDREHSSYEGYLKQPLERTEHRRLTRDELLTNRMSKSLRNLGD